MSKNGWTEERRRKQAEAIKRWKPWKSSTGPKTRSGKERVRYNALKHGNFTAQEREILESVRILIKSCKDFTKQIEIIRKQRPEILGLEKQTIEILLYLNKL